MTDKSKAEFELWISQQGMNTCIDDGLYRSHVVGWMWQAWQASRAALAVELPPQLDADDVGDEFFGPVDLADAVNDAINGCRAAFEAAGVKVKP